MANYNVAWNFTSSWEGPFNYAGSDTGHYLPRDGYSTADWMKKGWQRHKQGTNWGITPQFLHDLVKGYQYPNVPTAGKMASFDRNTAGIIWKTTVWAWMRGEQIKDDYVAALLFDCVVNRTGFLGSKEFKALFPQSPSTAVTYAALGTRKKGEKGSTDGQPILNQAGLNYINSQISAGNAKKLFDAIKSVFLNKYYKKGQRNRHKALQYGSLKQNTLAQPAPMNAELKKWAEWGQNFINKQKKI